MRRAFRGHHSLLVHPLPAQGCGRAGEVAGRGGCKRWVGQGHPQPHHHQTSSARAFRSLALSLASCLRLFYHPFLTRTSRARRLQQPQPLTRRRRLQASHHNDKRKHQRRPLRAAPTGAALPHPFCTLATTLRTLCPLTATLHCPAPRCVQLLLAARPSQQTCALQRLRQPLPSKALAGRLPAAADAARDRCQGAGGGGGQAQLTRPPCGPRRRARRQEAKARRAETVRRRGWVGGWGSASLPQALSLASCSSAAPLRPCIMPGLSAALPTGLLPLPTPPRPSVGAAAWTLTPGTAAQRTARAARAPPTSQTTLLAAAGGRRGGAAPRPRRSTRSSCSASPAGGPPPRPPSSSCPTSRASRSSRWVGWRAQGRHRRVWRGCRAPPWRAPACCACRVLAEGWDLQQSLTTPRPSLPSTVPRPAGL
mgnify:CR=1 FL=1